MERLQQLSNTDIDQDESWRFAPILVSNNRECLDLTFYQAKKFAESRGVPLVRWPNEFDKWIGEQRQQKYVDIAKEDPCFWQYFIPDAECFSQSQR